MEEGLCCSYENLNYFVYHPASSQTFILIMQISIYVYLLNSTLSFDLSFLFAQL